MATPTIDTRIRFEGLDDIKAMFADMQKSFESSAEKMRKAGEKVGDGLKKGVDGATKSVRTTGTVGVRSFSLLRSAAEGFVSVLRGGVSMLVSLGRVAMDIAGKVAVTGAAAFAAVHAFGIKTGQSIDELGRMAQAAGVPLERFSRLATATRLLGGSVQDLSSGLTTLSDKIIDAAKDAESSAGKAFEQLGINIRDAGGNIKSTEQVLKEVADGLARVPSHTLRASAAVDIFGTAAHKLLPILEGGSAQLEEYADNADRLGTVVTDAQAKTSRRLLVQYRMVAEALRGISYRIVDDLLPFLTRNSEATAKWLADNADRISAFAGKVLKEIAGISADLGRVIIGDGAKVEREWVRKIVPAVETARDVVLDLLELFTGGEATRAPWLKEVGGSLRAAAGAAKALAESIASAAGFGATTFPTIAEAAIAARMAIESFRDGIEGRGDEASMGWAANVGETVRNIGAAIGETARVVVENRDTITKFVADVTMLMAAASVAIGALLTGETIADGNAFAFLQEWYDSAVALYDKIRTATEVFVGDILAAWTAIEGIARTVYEIMDWVAKALGLDNAIQLGLVVLVLKFTGFLKLLHSVFGVLSTMLFTINGLIP